VYILILPAFGIYSEVTATFSGKRLFGYNIMVYATIAIALVSFLVWLHHFFTMGASANVNASFGIASMIIAIPTGVKIFNWLFTMYRGRVRFTTPMLWTLGFIVTFTIGGATGVLLAVPPNDFVLHNSELLIAHFHNVLIPGSLFGFFAGYAYWFPKALGFRLNERWGKRAFWAWVIGFYLAFMPLYVLGMMGMPRRMDYITNPAWHPYLVVAAVGAAVIAVGIACQIVQLIMSIRERTQTADLTGDPWNGRTLEWSVASPAPAYNFARIPVVRDIDAFTDMKERGAAYQRPTRYSDIHLPSNTAIGFLIGMFAFAFGFAMIWHIWWLAVAGALAILVSIIVRASRDDAEYVVPADEVERTENRWYRQLAAALALEIEPDTKQAAAAD
ncbi:MAG: cbb3-type cytochrome c oxidase subunit I, partial [Gemmataceae bacterium]